MTASSGLSAKQRRSALDALSRDVLAELTEAFELEVEDRRVKQGHVDAIIKSRSLSFRELLEMLKRAELKAMCEALGLSTKGRAKLPIVERILSMGESESDSGAAQVAVPGIELERAPSPKKAKKKAPKQAAPPPLLAFASGPPGSPKMGLRRFALRAAAGYRGKSGGETFARELLACFGVEEGTEDGPVFGHPISVVDAGKRGTRELTLYWPSRRVVLEVVDRDLSLDLAWGDLLRACLQMDSEPQYVVLTNQRDVRLYDLAKDRGAPRLSRALDELPKYSEAFVFFEPDWVPGSTPKIINDEKVSKEVADLVAKVYRVLKAKNPERDDAVIRFTLQCIIAMFAEDIGLLPKEYFTTLLYQAAEKGDAKKRLGELFKAMSTKGKNEDGIPYFNGGLFTDPVTLEIGTAPLRALTKAAEANWRYVDPHIFGSVFQGIMGDAERHASGAHYTAREDIMSVVGPTIVEPWRERISSASTLTELRAILTDLGTYRVLDPACGSGNFLYVAFRELYKLETEVLCRIYEDFASEREGSKRTSWVSSIHAKNFFGIDINPFAVELAKTTLNIAKKVAFDERMETVRALFGQGVLEVDPSLPLDNLDDTILVKDAVFSKWEAADAIIGNPPFLGEKRMRGELGVEYAREVQASFPGFGGDLCAVWFRKAHQLLKEGGRAGLIGTSAIRFGPSRRTSLDFISANGGAIVNAVSSKPWPGDAVVNVSIVNWMKGRSSRCILQVGDRIYHVREIAPHLQIGIDTTIANVFKYPKDSAAMGVIFGSGEFIVEGDLMLQVRREGCLRLLASAADILSGKIYTSPRHVIWLGDEVSEADAKTKSPAGFRHLKEHVYPTIQSRAASQKSTAHYKGWLKKWWGPQMGRSSFREANSDMQRMIACSKVQSRPIFFFLSNKVICNPTLWIFACDDDFSFGIMQSSVHWAWALATGSRLKSDHTYTSTIWKTFPWPQEPSIDDVVAVAIAGRELRASRRSLMEENGYSLRELHQSAEVSGPHPLKKAQAALDRAVEAAYGKPADQEATEFLLELNLCLAEDEANGETIQGPGLPKGLDPKDPRWFSTDCIEPPPLNLEDTNG